MHVCNPIEQRCTLKPQTLRNRNGAVLSDFSVNSFTVTVSKDELPDLICQLVASYRDCTDARTVALLIGRLAAEQCLALPRIERRAKPRTAGLLLAQEQEP